MSGKTKKTVNRDRHSVKGLSFVYPGKNTYPHPICHAKHAKKSLFVMQIVDGDGCFSLDIVSAQMLVQYLIPMGCGASEKDILLAAARTTSTTKVSHS